MAIIRVDRFLPRDGIHKRGQCRRAVSVWPPVCHIRAFLSKRINTSSHFSPWCITPF